MGCGGSSAAAQEPRRQATTDAQLQFQDTDGDLVQLKLEGGQVNEYANGKLQFQGLAYFEIDKNARTYSDSTGDENGWRLKGTFKQNEDLDKLIRLRDALFNRHEEPRPAVAQLVAGQHAIIHNCLNARLNGERVVLEKFDTGLNEWLVKGDKFPLSIGMSIGAQFLEATEDPTLLTSASHHETKLF